MSAQDQHGELDSLVALVRGAQPRATPREEDVDTRIVATAMLAGATRHRRRVLARVGFGALSLAALVALAVTGALATREGTAERTHEPTRVTLASGDVLTAVAGARFAVEPTAAGTRHVRLDHGAMLFDVRPLGHGEHFEVVTRDARVRVTGTVFAVETSPHGTSVRVFEGHVAVHDRNGEHALSAGDTLGIERSSGGLAELTHAGTVAANRRSASEPPSLPLVAVAVLPSTRPLAAVGGSQSSRFRTVAPTTIDPSAARAWIAEGHAELALRAAHARRGGEWRFVEADALRALRRFPEAAAMYDIAAHGLAGDERAQAAYLAATVHLDENGDGAAAIASLDAAAVDAPGASLRERALTLRARALDALHRDAELRDVARLYLDAYAHGSRADWMRARLGTR